MGMRCAVHTENFCDLRQDLEGCFSQVSHHWASMEHDDAMRRQRLLAHHRESLDGVEEQPAWLRQASHDVVAGAEDQDVTMDEMQMMDIRPERVKRRSLLALLQMDDDDEPDGPPAAAEDTAQQNVALKRKSMPADMPLRASAIASQTPEREQKASRSRCCGLSSWEEMWSI